EKLGSPDILDLVDRTAGYWDESQESHWPLANPSTITIRTTAGQELSKTLVFPPGNPNNFLGDAMLAETFRQLTRGVLEPEMAEKVIALTHQLPALPDVRGLTELLRSTGKG